MKLLLQFLLVVACHCMLNAQDGTKPPHIIFIYADDLGWNDVSFHGASDIPTPNIDALALNGIILNNYYGEWLCTPSRGALLSGKYPIRLGLQHFLIIAGEATALPLNVTILPEHLKRLGYATHMIGKWHLGHQNKENTPTYRGFDSFFGYYNGFIDYYDYTHIGETYLPRQSSYYGVDLHNGTDTVYDFRGKYATHVFADHAKDIIMNHDSSKPLFMYLPHLAVHIGTDAMLLQAPPEIISKFKHIKDMNQRIHAATVSALDDAVGTVFEALNRRDMLKDSIVIFVSDNGGLNDPEFHGYSSNYPLRGSKYTPWEGGLRIPAVIWSPRLHLHEPVVSKQLMHATDWLPTLYNAAGGNVNDLGSIDGIDIWDTLTINTHSRDNKARNFSNPSLQGSPPPQRKEILHVLDNMAGVSAFRRGEFKVVNGTTVGSFGNNFWLGPTYREHSGRPSTFEEIFKNRSVVGDILMREGWWISQDPNKVYQEALITCRKPPPADASDCNPNEAPCLFNIMEDPCEYHNLAKKHPQILNALMDEIHSYSKQQVPPQSKSNDPRADPACHNFAYVTWLDPEHYTECNYASES